MADQSSHCLEFTASRLAGFHDPTVCWIWSGTTNNSGWRRIQTRQPIENRRPSCCLGTDTWSHSTRIVRAASDATIRLASIRRISSSGRTRIMLLTRYKSSDIPMAHETRWLV